MFYLYFHMVGLLHGATTFCFQLSHSTERIPLQVQQFLHRHILQSVFSPHVSSLLRLTLSITFLPLFFMLRVLLPNTASLLIHLFPVRASCAMIQSWVLMNSVASTDGCHSHYLSHEEKKMLNPVMANCSHLVVIGAEMDMWPISDQ